MNAMAEKGAHGAAVQAVRGLAVSDHGLTLKLAQRTVAAGKRVDLAFRIVDRRGQRKQLAIRSIVLRAHNG